jgi:hypothetical protein
VIRFTEQEWKAIANTLPPSKQFRRRMDSKRREVEGQLNFFLKYRQSLWTSLRTKRSIKKVKNYATKLQTELEYLTNDPVYLSAGRSMGSPSNRDFSSLLSALDNVQREMESTESRTSMKPGRKSAGPVDFLVTHLNWIQNVATRDNVIRSKKKTEKASGSNFIYLCCQKVGLSKGQVDRALMRNISKFHSMLSYSVDLSSDPFGAGNHKSGSKRARPRSKS